MKKNRLFKKQFLIISIISAIIILITTYVACYYIANYLLEKKGDPKQSFTSKKIYSISLLIWFLLFLIWEVFLYKNLFLMKNHSGTFETERTQYKKNKVEKEFKLIPKKEVALLDEQYGIPIKQLFLHCLLIGKTGAGKTTTIKRFVSQLEEKDPNGVSIIIDGKGDLGLIEEMKDENTYVWTMDGDISWNPIAYNGDISVVVDKLSTFFGDNEYFKGRGVRFLDNIVNILVIEGENINMLNIMDYVSDPIKLKKKVEKLRTYYQQELLKLKNSENFLQKDIDVVTNKLKKINDVYYWIKNLDEQHIAGMSDALYNLYSPVAKSIRDKNTLNEIIQKHKRIIFSLNSLKNSLRAGMIGQLLIQDLKELSTIKSKNININLFLDELNVFISDDLINLINKTRSAGFRNFLSFQTIADLKVNGNDLKDIIFGNVSCLVVHESPSTESREYIAKTLGTKEMYENTAQVDYSGLTTATRGSVKTINSFVVHPDEIKDLKVGEAFIKIPLPSGTKLVKKIKIKK